MEMKDKIFIEVVDVMELNSSKYRIEYLENIDEDNRIVNIKSKYADSNAMGFKCEENGLVCDGFVEQISINEEFLRKHLEEKYNKKGIKNMILHGSGHGLIFSGPIFEDASFLEKYGIHLPLLAEN
ncbi:MAG: hypothetical protein K2X04_02030 [Burkholderiales bacterium]|nr:hypothetical protein [Burkholderiales bacterium]